MRKFIILLGLGFLFLVPSPVLAAPSNSIVANFATSTLNTLVVFAALATTFFIVKGGYLYITSSGKPDQVEDAKKTIRNALIGLVMVLGAAIISSLFSNALNPSVITNTQPTTSVIPSPEVTPTGGLTQVLIDAVIGFLRNIVESSAKPLVDAVMTFVTTTPSVSSNSVIFNFWLVMIGITDALFVLVVALLGFQFMSADTFGFEELELKQILPKLGLAFLGANISIFLIDWVILLCNTLVNAVLKSTGGLSQAWISDAFAASVAAPLIILIFMVLFVILATVLLLFYISRLIVIAIGAVMAPLIFLLWVMPKFSSIAEISVKTYLATIFTVFVHVIIIQLAASFLTIPGQTGTNPLMSILVAIGIFFTLLKTPSTMMQLVIYTSNTGAIRKMGTQIINVMSSAYTQATNDAGKKLPKGAQS